MVGVRFFRDFLKHCQRDLLDDYFYSELVDLTTDADILTRIEAIDALTTISDYVDKSMLEQMDIQATVKDLIENHMNDYRVVLSKAMGRILFLLSKYNLHTELQQQFVETFKNFIDPSQNIEVRRNAAYNLPCFYTTFKDIVTDYDWEDVFLTFA